MKRIVGIDVARALAIIGMIIVNFKIAFGQTGSQWLNYLTRLIEGKAAATFVVLAGVGIAFMTNSAIQTNEFQKIKKTTTKIVKRALFLFAIGLLYMPIWFADILHFYGIYMLFTLWILKYNKEVILITALFIIIIYPLLMFFWNYDLGWNYALYTYADFWTVKGFVRNLFFNGFHPVFPWVAFMLIGVWFGRHSLNDIRFVKRAFLVSFSVFISVQLISFLLIFLFSKGNLLTTEEIHQVFGTQPMPPLPLYMLSGSSLAMGIISTCILLAKKFEKSIIIYALATTGRLALTFYVAHVMIGMTIIEAINPNFMGHYPLTFSVAYAIAFSLICVFFAIFWTRIKKQGPLEWLMRKLTD